MTEYELSNAQKRIWFTQKKYKDSPLFNIGGTVRIKGPVDLSLLKRALKVFIHDHTALRLRFTEQSGHVYQYVCDDEPEIETLDFASSSEPEAAYWKWCEESAKTAFPMTDRPLYYFAVFRLSDGDKGYFVKIHHILADGWSTKLLTEQVTRYYEAVRSGNILESGEKPSYLDAITKEQNERYDKMKVYWQEMFTPIPELLTRSDMRNLRGKRKTYYIDKETRQKLDACIAGSHISYHTFFTCLYLLYSYKKYGREDIVIGNPLLGRTGSTERRIFGNFTNTMPYRYLIDKNQTINEMLAAVSSDLKKSFVNQKYPYNLLYENLNFRENGAQRLYDVCINYYNTVLPKELDGYKIENTEFYNSEQEYALQIIIRHWKDGELQLDFDYQLSRYSERQIDNMYKQMTILMEQMMQSASSQVKDIMLLGETEKQAVIYQYNSTKQEYPKNKTWLDLFLSNVERYPRHIAVSKGLESLTYQELDIKSNQIAQHLFSTGVEAEDIVAAILGHDIDTVAAILAIMKCGAVYLPMDLNTPRNRIREILAESKARYLLVKEYDAENYDVEVISLCHMTHDNDNLVKINLCTPSDIAYLLYTSGSSGTPKGVPIHHKNLMNYLCWARNTYITKEREVFALYSSLAFDFTMTSIFLPLISGGEIRLYDGQSVKNIFSAVIRENMATIVKITPSHIPLLTDVPVDKLSIHTFIIGGEDLKRELCGKLYRNFHGDVSIYNEYGPTEATIGCMTYLYQEVDRENSVPIGRPIANTQIYLLDADLQPVPEDTTGEIYIGGDSVSAGYYMLPEETNKRFIDNPYIKDSIIYKTGDLAYRNEAGALVYYGRCGDEMKIRGNRVNLSEITSKIMESTMAENAYVCSVACGDSVQLCAYIIQNSSYDLEQLKEFLKTQLPEYELPQFYVCLREFPLTINGKIDSTKLPAPDFGSNIAESISDGQIDVLISAISSVISDRDILPKDNFYAIGGDSIKAIQISSRLQEKGYELTVRDILLNPTISSMSALIKIKNEQQYEQGICKGQIKKTPIVSRFFEQHFADEGYYNQSVLLKLKKFVSAKVLNKAFRVLIRHHDALRINYDGYTNQLFYNNRHLACKSIVKSKYSLSLRPEILNKILNKKLNHRFNLKKDLLIRPYYITNQKDIGYLYITVHHLVIDGVSWRILLEDLAELLEHMDRSDFRLPAKTASCACYAEAYSKYSKAAHFDTSYWYKICEERKDIVPTDVSGKTFGQRKKINFHLDKVYTEMFTGKANEKYHTKPDELLLIALAFALEEMYQFSDMRVDVERHGRDILGDADISRTVGWFTNIFPVHIRMTEEGYIEKIQSVREQIRQTGSRGYEYGILKYIKKQLEDREKNICLNYLGEYVQRPNKYFTLSRILFDNAVSPDNEVDSCFHINAFVMEKCLNIYIFYIDALEEDYLPHSFSSCYRRHLTDLLEHCVDN